MLLETHVVFCITTTIQRVKLWNDSLKDLKIWLNKQHTEPNLLGTISKYLTHRGGYTFKAMSIDVPSLHQLAHKQDEIGCDNFVKGRISTKFCEIHDAYFYAKNLDQQF